MLQNEAKPVDQSSVELGSVAISGEVDTCSISTGDGRIWVGRGFVAVITGTVDTCSICMRGKRMVL
jgi:hypothetical protein